MTSTSRPFKSRVRRRVLAVVWLLALLVVCQSAVAALCLADGVGAGTEPATVDAASALASASPIAHDDADAAPCWHGGSGGCHCACGHSATLPAVPASWNVARFETVVPSSIAASGKPIRLATDLRPPIA